ncbi:MAG: type II secretion system inner membrane protein GspF [Thiotrichaceae bacterium]
MPAFEYTILNSKGAEETGILEADTARQVRQILREGGNTPLEVDEVKESSKNATGGKTNRGKMKPADLALITRQFATLLESGAPLEEALATTARQTEKKSVKRIMSAVRSRVIEGHSLASALKAFPNAFPHLYQATIDAGEKSGHLDAVLDRLADYTESRQEMQQKITTAMFYPAILVFMAIAIVSGLLGYVVPKVVTVFQDMDQELPLLTQAILALSDFITGYGIYVVIGIAIAIFLFKRLLRLPEWRYRFDRFKLKIPLVGRLVRGSNTASFARTLSILSSSGVPILDALSISAQVMQNMPMKEAVEKAAVKVREGAPIHKALEQSGYFPPMTVYLIASGESSGKLDAMLERAAIQQERETDGTLTALLSIFEPVLIVIMGIIVLLIVLAILLPIFELNDLVK